MRKISSAFWLLAALAASSYAESRGQGLPERAVRVSVRFSGSHTEPSLSVGATERGEEVVRHRYGAPYHEPLYFELIGKLDGQQDAGLIYAGTLADPRGHLIEQTVKRQPAAEKPMEWDEEGSVDLILPDVAGATLRVWRRTPEDKENPRKKLLETNL